MLNVKVTNRMSHEDYVAVYSDHPYALSRRHLLGICCTIIVCLVLILPIPGTWHDGTDTLSPQLSKESQAYLATDESATAKALAEAEHETLPHQENYDDYDIPSAQFTNNDNLDDATSSAESELEDDLQYHSVTDSDIANHWQLAHGNLQDESTEQEQAETSQDPLLAEQTSTQAQDGKVDNIKPEDKADEGTRDESKIIASQESSEPTKITEPTEATEIADTTETTSDLNLPNAKSQEDSKLAKIDSASSSETTLAKDQEDKATTDTESLLAASEKEKVQGDKASKAQTQEQAQPKEQEQLLAEKTTDTSASSISAKEQTDSATKAIPTQDQSKEQAYLLAGTWYRYTVERGDNFSVIFKNLDIPFATLNRITKVAKQKDIALDVGAPLYLMIDKEDVLLQLVNPLDKTNQVRFTRTNGEEDFKVVHEKLNSHTDNAELLANLPDAYTMPSAVELLKKRKDIATKREQAIAQRKAYEKANNINPERPRLVIGKINKGENFTKAAHREGLTPTEIKTISKLFQKKVNVNKLKSGDSFRVLFTGIGTKADICAISFAGSQGKHEIFLNPKDRNFYGENEYTPTAGIFRRFPLAGEIKVTSNFNPRRRHPVTKRVSPHNGVDFKASVGTPVYAPADGVVTFSGYQRAAGYYVIVRHSNNYSTVYMHLSKSEVKKGEKVVVGQVIARSGNTGRTTGPHLHYEIRINDRPVNPLKVELPTSSHPNLAREQREAFANNVKILRSDLQNDRLAAAKP